ncbi:hypothetical protein Tcan_14302 [Toxocara canis]|uniref:Uncharacterized protein n=1 Tax=Toxocara canis TaxID=6265 RepID=A0A0B2VC62_TOXCA|nr:hypothetical protein Tcan_14302 [Toxocara canis]
MLHDEHVFQKCNCLRLQSDGILVVAGLPNISDEHVRNAITFAIDLQALVKSDLRVKLFLVITACFLIRACFDKALNLRIIEGSGGRGGGWRASRHRDSGRMGSVDAYLFILFFK